MSKPESYPFLRIARDHGINYSDVLAVADQLRRTQRAIWREPVNLDAFIEIASATDIQAGIREGVIDWQTGASVTPRPEGDGWIEVGTDWVKDTRPMDVCPSCAGSGWQGHGMGGDTCGECGGSGVEPIPARSFGPLEHATAVVEEADRGTVTGRFTPGTLAYAEAVQAEMCDITPRAGETPEEARARRDYYRGFDDDGLPSD
jgi:hypothetical protein